MKKALMKLRDRFAALYQKYGWKAVAGVFVYYLVRDVTLYIVLPMFVLSRLP